MAKKQVNLKLDPTDIANLTAKRGSVPFQTYVEALIKKDIYGKLENELSVKDEVEKLETDASMEVLWDKAILEDMKVQMAKDPAGLLKGMDQKDKLALMARRMGKSSVDPELENQAIALKDCINLLPSIPDITKELSHAKNRMKKAQHELEMEKCVVKPLRSKLIKAGEWEAMKEFLDEAGKMLNDWGRDCRARDIPYEKIKLIAIAKGVVKE